MRLHYVYALRFRRSVRLARRVRSRPRLPAGRWYRGCRRYRRVPILWRSQHDRPRPWQRRVAGLRRGLPGVLSPMARFRTLRVRRPRRRAGCAVGRLRKDMPTSEIGGIHHVTAISGNAQENLDFYAGVLGMRLVKKSVNQDDPGTYHLFYADADGHPGTDLTFFPFRFAAPGRLGVGLGIEIALAIPHGSLAYWRERLTEHDAKLGADDTRRGEHALTLT